MGKKQHKQKDGTIWEWEVSKNVNKENVKVEDVSYSNGSKTSEKKI